MKILQFPETEKKPCTKSMESLYCQLIDIADITDEITRLEFEWNGPDPRAGQFFMLRPERSSFFLGRPISVESWKSQESLRFYVLLRGRGSRELIMMHPGDYVDITGPLGNSWEDFIKPEFITNKPIALVGGGVGIAPLLAFNAQFPQNKFDIYAGFKLGFFEDEDRKNFFGITDSSSGIFNGKLIVSAEEEVGNGVLEGRITDFFQPEGYFAVCACGPEPMLRVVAAKCKKANVPCFISTERRMACGVGACLGCTIATTSGNKRCCADGPIFPAEDIL